MHRSTPLGAIALTLGLPIPPGTQAQQLSPARETPTIDQLISLEWFDRYIWGVPTATASQEVSR